MKKYILIDVVPLTISKEEAKENLEETVSLIETFGGGKVVEIIQRRANPHPGTFIGKGKAEHVGDLIKKHTIDIVIINGLASSSQLYELLRMYWKISPTIQVWDRVDLILHIFDKHARTAEAKLQIELAKMRHMGPRMYGLSEELGRQAGGIGTRGIGETNIERMKRHWRNEINKIKEKLEKHEALRMKQIKRRLKEGFKTVSIVGYTNAGKTSLYNTLTKKNKKAKDVLFATLDSTVGEIYYPSSNPEQSEGSGFKILISDTIGFIQNLPPQLIDAFKSTLMESVHADLLLHVIDISDSKMYEKIKVVEDILKDLDMEQKKKIKVFNKVDKSNVETVRQIKEKFKEEKIFISVKEEINIEKLKEMIKSN